MLYEHLVVVPHVMHLRDGQLERLVIVTTQVCETPTPPPTARSCPSLRDHSRTNVPSASLAVRAPDRPPTDWLAGFRAVYRPVSIGPDQAPHAAGLARVDEDGQALPARWWSWCPHGRRYRVIG